MSGFWLISYIVLWLLVVIMGLMIIGMLRNIGVLYESLSNSTKSSNNHDGIPTKAVVGTTLPSTMISTAEGDDISTESFKGKKMAISIISPNCQPCKNLLEHLSMKDRKIDPLDETVRDVAIISVGDKDKTLAMLEHTSVPKHIPIFFDLKKKIFIDWGVVSTPTTIIIDNNNNVVRHIIGITS